MAKTAAEVFRDYETVGMPSSGLHAPLKRDIRELLSPLDNATVPGVFLSWDLGVSDADPGTGKIRANNASLASAAFLYVSKSNRSGSSIATFLLSLAGSTSAVKGKLSITNATQETQAFFDVASVTDASGYVKIGVSNHSGETAFAADTAITFNFARTGDAGAGSGDVVGPASVTDGRIALFDGASGKLLKQHSAAPGAHAAFNSADQTEAETGTSSTTGMTPQRTLQAIKAARSREGAACMINGIITSTATGSSISFAVKTQAGADPSAGDPVYFIFRDFTAAASGAYNVRAVTSALSITVSNGSTLGAVNGIPFKVWIFAIDNAGTVELGVINCCDSNLNIYPLGRFPFVSTTAEGGAGGADSALTLYTATARSTVPLCILGYASWESGLGTAGTWNVDATRQELFHARTPLPGEPINPVGNATGAVATGTTTTPNDDSIPQNTEGTEFLSQQITPTSAANLLEVEAKGVFAVSTGATAIIAALHQDSVANALVAELKQTVGANAAAEIILKHRKLAGGTSATTFKMRAGPESAATITFNGTGGGRKLGGVMNSYMNCREIMT